MTAARRSAANLGRDIALVAVFAAFIAVCSIIAIPIGAAPITLQTFAVLLAGLVLGFAVGYAAARILSAKLGAASGVAMPVEFHAADVRMLLAFLVAAAAVTLLPAFLAYRQTPAQALRA